MISFAKKTADEFYAFSQLVRRHCKVFLKDGMAVFFSLLAPIIVFMLYVLFLGDIQADTVAGFSPTGCPCPTMRCAPSWTAGWCRECSAWRA